MRRSRRSYLPHWQDWRSERHDSITAFRDAGILTITDMTLETRPCVDEEFRNYPMGRSGPGSHRRMYMSYGPVARGRGLPGPTGGAPAFTTTRRPLGTTTTTANFNTNNNNNNNDRDEMPAPVKKQDKLQEAEIRSFFPETWLWDLHHIGETGEKTIPKKVWLTLSN